MSGLAGCVGPDCVRVVGRMQTAAGVGAQTLRVCQDVALCVFGARDVELAAPGPGASAVVLCGYVLADETRLSATGLLERLRAGGASLLPSLRGEYAVAACLDGAVTLLRDPLGARPLYVATLDDGGVAFATSIGCLLAAGVSPEIDRDAVVRSLVLGYVPAPQTVLAQVKQIGPGETMSLRPLSAPRRYFQPRERLDRDRSLRTAAAQLSRGVTRAVARALPPRGRVGAFLSGGLDSSLVLARVHEAGRDVDAFTLHFGDRLPGELRYARAVAAHLGVRHHVLEVDDRLFCDALAPALEKLEDLLSEPIAVPNFLLAREAARTVDVLFTGEGGDPPFGGPKNVGMALAHAYRDLPGAPSLAASFESAHHHLGDDLDEALTPEWRASFDRARFHAEIVAPFLGEGAPGETFVGRLMMANTVLKGGSNILVKAAKMVGAHDLALRSPLFDRDLIELAFTIPPWQKLSGTDEKLVLKAAAARSLPRSVLERGKRGMAVPLRAWCDGALGALAHDVLTERAVRERGLFRWSYVQRLLRLESTPSDLARSRAAEKLWIALVTELQQRTIARLSRGVSDA